MTEPTCFKLSIENKVAHIQLARPEAFNAMPRAFWNELPELVRDIDDNAKARAIVISSNISRLRAREVQLNDAERKEKAQQRLRQIEEKQASAAAATTPPASAVVRKAEPTGRSGARENTAGSVKLRDREAAARASQQRERQQSQAAEQALREKESAERAAQARQRQLEVEKAAQARRAKREQEKADAAANGHKPAATLPTPP